MKPAEIKKLSVAELQEKIANEVTALAQLKTTQVVSELSNTAQIKHKRRLVARLKTDLRSRELAETK
ncbi:MAG TPA: 50S ribosomal protein L29 [Luteibaculaceae bacterium]|nr:50S ribosomal protein L29 [Luteibaculaceae bacterium]